MAQAGKTSDVVELLGLFNRETASLDFARIVSGALAFLHDHLAVARATVALVREDGPGFLVFDTSLPIAGVESGAVLPANAASIGDTVRERRTIYRQDVRTWPVPNPVDDALLAAGLSCTLSTPLVVGDRCIGTLNVAVRELDGLPEGHRTLLELLAPRLAEAIQNGLAVAALARSEEQFRSLFERVSDGIVVVERSTGKFLLANQAMAKLLRRSPSEMLRLGVQDIHPADEYPRIRRLFETLAGGDLQSANDVPLLRSDGSVLLADASASGMEMRGTACVVGVFRDAGERQRREQELLFTQKMDSIRVLAAGIAHDFNNLLTGILGNVTLARELVESRPEAVELLGEAERACDRATRLTRQLLTFARGGAPIRRVVDLGPVVRDAANLASAGTPVRCELDSDPGLWPALADESQISQVVQNLVLNAVQATAGAGVVKLALRNAPAGPSPDGMADRDAVCIVIEDEGCGIPAGDLERIFLPFFTTKPSGSGLGLAVAHSIVTNHGGRVRVTSEVGKGSAFRFCLPAERGVVLGSPPADARTVTSGHGRLLVMDDEHVVRAVAARVLSRAGFEVVCVEHGAAAVEAFERALAQGNGFDVVVLDLTVPGGMGGREAAQRIRAISPSARLLVSSGYSSDPVMSEPAKHGLTGVLPKPYSATQLVDAVTAALATPRAS